MHALLGAGDWDEGSPEYQAALEDLRSTMVSKQECRVEDACFKLSVLQSTLVRAQREGDGKNAAKQRKHVQRQRK
jgi:hypothetical protein